MPKSTRLTHNGHWQIKRPLPQKASLPRAAGNRAATFCHAIPLSSGSLLHGGYSFRGESAYDWRTCTRGRKMKKHLVAAAIIGFSSFSANAADLAVRPSYKAAAAPIPYLSWNKCYVGISGGYITSAGSRNVSIVANDVNLALSQTLGNVPTSLSSDPDGGIVGGQVGCNYQTGNLVLGGETDISYTRSAFPWFESY
jgi:hypothetical protein